MQAELEPQAYEKLLAESVDVLTVLNPAGVIQYESPSVRSVLGYDPDELVGASVFEYIHPDDRADAVETFKRLVDTETEHTTETVELRFKCGDGSWIWLESRASNRSIDGVGGYVVNSRAIAALNQREAQLEQTRDLLRNTERIADVGGWTIDTEAQDVFWTEHLFELLGWPGAEEPPLDEALDVYHEDDRPAVEAAVEDALTTGEPFDVEARFHREDETLRWFRIQGIPTVEDGEVVTLRGAVQDITDHENREQELERYQTIVEASGDPVYTLDETGQFTSVNEALVTVSGYDEDELLGNHASILIPQEYVERSEQAIRSLLGRSLNGYSVSL